MTMDGEQESVSEKPAEAPAEAMETEKTPEEPVIAPAPEEPVNDPSSEEPAAAPAPEEPSVTTDEKMDTAEAAPATVDPKEIDKKPQVIKEAQEEIKKLDIFVCGECLQVFHFLKQFEEHRSDGSCSCVPKTHVQELCKGEEQPHVWAFTLWKHSQNEEKSNSPSAWMMYQRWCKLDPSEKQSWIAAGKSLQSFSTISNAKLQRVKNNVKYGKGGYVAGNKRQLDDIDAPTPPRGRVGRPPKKKPAEVAKSATDQDLEEALERIHKGTPVKKNDVKKEDPITLSFKKRPPEERKALRSLPNGEKEECVVEKITKKRLHPKNKTIEYFAKWENLDDTKSSWELSGNFDQCKWLLDDFEAILAKQKLSRSLAAQANATLTPGGRPQRSSKQKALNQVKEWCGDISDGDGSGKSDEESSEKAQGETESSDEDKTGIKKLVKPNPLSQTSEKIIIPTTQKIVRINQKQMPNLSTGVYLMSKTEGIIKLNSDTNLSKNSVLKVGTKIGQTHIKVVKKDDGQTTSRIIKLPQKKPEKTYASKQQGDEKKMEDESDDGLEEMEFPKEIQMPDPDSPPGEFTLCPLTGKVLGQDYSAEKAIAIKNETDTQNAASPSSLDVLVKQAVSELTEDDLHPDNTVTTDHLITKTTAQSSETASVTITPKKSLATTSRGDNSVVSMANGVNSASIQKKLLSSPNVVRNKICAVKPTTPKPTTTIIHKISGRTPNTIRKRPPLPPTANFEPVLKRSPNVATYKGGSMTRRLEGYRNTAKPPLKHIMTSTPTVKTPAPPKEATPVMNMPLLTTDQQPVAQESTSAEHVAASLSDLSSIATGGGDTPMLITGEDGTIYQVAGQNEDGQTILISQGPDGQQQCVLVASETQVEEHSEAVATATEPAAEEQQATNLLTVDTESDVPADADSQVVAQIVKADPPSPGGTRKVVLMLPDGNYMMTEVSAEQYAALELDK